MRRSILVMLLAASAATLVVAQAERLDYTVLGSIRDEGLNLAGDGSRLVAQ